MALFDFLKKKPFEPETFSGTEEFLHVNTMDQPLTQVEAERPVRGHGGSVVGDAFYMSDKTDRKWFAPGTDVGNFMQAESGKPEGVYKIKTKFNNALVVTPQNIDAIEDNLLQGVQVERGTAGGSDQLRARLQELGYDGLVVRGFDELPESYYNRQFGTRESPLVNVTQDQVIAFDPAESVQDIKEVNPRDYHKGLITKAEDKAIDRRITGKGETVLGVPGTDTVFYDAEDAKMALEDGSITQAEYDSLKPRKSPTYDLDKRKSLIESVRSRAPDVDAATRKIGPSFGKALGLAGLGLAFTDAKKVYAQGMEQDMGPVISSLAAGGKFAYDTIAPAFTMIFDSKNVGEGSDVVPEGEMFIDPFVTGTSMPKYTSLEPDKDLFKGGL